jgi:uncharacterized repeat protein (TIGR01451 family)
VTNPTVAGSSGVTITAVGTISYVWSVSDLAFGQSGTITVTAAISDLLAAGTFTNTAQIASTSRDLDETDNSSDSAVTVPDVYGVTVAPPTDAASGDPGSAVTYTLVVTNTGNTVDTFTLSTSGDSWTTVVPASVGPLAAGASATVVVTVTVDGGAACGDSDGVTVTATSQGSGTESDSSTLTTSANAVYGVTVAPPADSASGDPGADVVYTLWVTNTGNCADTFTLSKSGDTWTTVVPASVGPLAAGASATVAVTVTVPGNATVGSSDTVTISATSQGDGTESDSSTLTTSHSPEADLSISKTSNRSGDNVTFVIVVRNRSGDNVTFVIVVRNAGPSDVSGPIISDTVPAGMSAFDWTCVAGGGATCTASGSGDINDTVNLPSGSVLTYTVNATIAAQGLVVNTAEVIAPAGVIDPDMGNNRASADTMVYIYLPLVFRNHVNAPDLVVESITATSSNVQVVIRNQGNGPVVDQFWVDAYINPHTVPTKPNETWDLMGNQGIAWIIQANELPLAPGQGLTLTVGDGRYVDAESNVDWPLASGSMVYAQVDSASKDVWYGAVLEDHERNGAPYINNILGPVTSTAVGGAPAPVIVENQIQAIDWPRKQ